MSPITMVLYPLVHWIRALSLCFHRLKMWELQNAKG